ncbi:MAG: sigma factor-like helix-turn-helix DNA-binding protein [Polyangia bacterium]|nr:sigma factor-like helix-turn-helix DNA-binding protein [Polyangia bacterium]
MSKDGITEAKMHSEINPGQATSEQPPGRSSVRRRNRRRQRMRSKTIAPKRLSKDELRQMEVLAPFNEIPRPRSRKECAHGLRPCPFVSCRHHLFLDVNEEKGSLKLNFPDLEVWELPETCSLDVADRGGMTLEEVGEIMNLTRERIRQVEVKGLKELKRSICSERLATYVKD